MHFEGEKKKHNKNKKKGKENKNTSYNLARHDC